ncbi:hypothetical protein HBB16_10070 [Pseudonocardia sp. MCCB 268]|nr:hypothetical protein [Pseudonocardia cytotoxica]
MVLACTCAWPRETADTDTALCAESIAAVVHAHEQALREMTSTVTPLRGTGEAARAPTPGWRILSGWLTSPAVRVGYDWTCALTTTRRRSSAALG